MPYIQSIISRVTYLSSNYGYLWCSDHHPVSLPLLANLPFSFFYVLFGLMEYNEAEWNGIEWN